MPDVLGGGDPIVVMYHYVREPHPGKRQPPHLTTARFRRQIEVLAKCRIVVTPDDFLAWVNGAGALPNEAALLTFDDGLADHRREVHPILAEHGIKAAFYPNARSVLDRAVLPVHKLQFVIANAGDPAKLLDEVRNEMVERGLAATADKPLQLRLDGAEVTEIKRLLQRDLPREDRCAIVDELFRRHVTADERAFADELYLDEASLKEMAEYGHHVGNHGGRHERYSTLSADEQADDIDDGLRLVREVGGENAPHTFCFPFGEYDTSTLTALKRRGCVAAFGTMPAAVGEGADPLQVPRYDCIDLPS